MTSSPQSRPKESCISRILKWLLGVVIITMFLGLLFPAYVGPPRGSSRRAIAKNDVTQIVTAVKAFYTEYGYYPVGGWQTKSDAYYGTKPMPSTLVGKVENMHSNSLLIDILRNNTSGADAAIMKSLNPREIVSLDPPIVKSANNPVSGVVPDGAPNAGVWFDPWGSPYNVLINSSYSGTLPNPYVDAPGGANLTTGVIVWSYGKNGVLGGGPAASSSFTSESGTAGCYYSKPGGSASGDVISWQ